MKPSSVAGLCAALALLPAVFAAPANYLTTGVDYSSGDYGGSTRSETFAINASFDREFGPLSVGVSRSYLRVTNPGVSIPGVGPVVSQETITRVSATNPRLATWLARYSASRSSASAADDETEDGLGDTYAYGTYTFAPVGRLGWEPSLSAEVKFGTADADKGLGTGETDYRISASLRKSGERRGLALGIGYQFLGDPDGFELNNGLFASLSLWRNFTTDGTIAFSIDWSAAATDETDDALALSTRYTHRFGESLAAFASLGTGLTDSSPDVTCSLGLECSF
jgi:hypothetical protein